MGTLFNRRRYMGGKYEPLEDRIVTTFNVADASSATKICHTYNVTNKIESVEIDGVLMGTVSSSYQLSLGDHTIKIRMKDVTETCNYLFYDVKRITSAVLPYCLNKINDYTFSGCSNIESITIPYGVTRINGGAFNGCAKLTEMVIPDSVTTWSGSFYNCSNLESVTLPLSVTSLPGQCFANCSKLKRINSNTDGVFYIPAGVTSIGNIAFRRTLVTNLLLPNTLTTLGMSAFNSCESLIETELPSVITSIGDYAFADCPLTSGITIRATTPPTLGGTHVFRNSAIIYVSSASVSDYQTAWSNYASQIQAIPS